MTNSKIEALEAYIRKIAENEALFEDVEFNPCDFSGGNFDDAYSIGVDDGEIVFARELIKKFFNND